MDRLESLVGGKTDISWLWVKYAGGVMESKRTLRFLASGWTVVSLTSTGNPEREAGWEVKKETMSLIWGF